ncbi:hypothetical protein M5G07_00020 [Serratia symbiotica]|nr:hypothetical protein [Serratia symbiotica]
MRITITGHCVRAWLRQRHCLKRIFNRITTALDTGENGTLNTLCLTGHAFSVGRPAVAAHGCRLVGEKRQ